MDGREFEPVGTCGTVQCISATVVPGGSAVFIVLITIVIFICDIPGAMGLGRRGKKYRFPQVIWIYRLM